MKSYISLVFFLLSSTYFMQAQHHDWHECTGSASDTIHLYLTMNDFLEDKTFQGPYQYTMTPSRYGELHILIKRKLGKKIN